MSPRPPSIDPGVTSFVWAIVLGLLIWGFLLAIGMSKPESFIIAALAGCAIYFYVRVRGEDEPRRGRR